MRAIEAPNLPWAAMSSHAEASTAPNTPRKKKSSSSSLFSLKCGCSNAKSVSVSTSHCSGSHRTSTTPAAASLSARHRPLALSARFEYSSSDTIALTTATTSTSHDEEEDGERSPSFSGLLRQLRELEQSVIAWDHFRQAAPGSAEPDDRTVEEEENFHRAHVAARTDHRQWRQKQHHHRRSHSEGGVGRSSAFGKMGGTLVVVTETEDPLGEFRRSMTQMIVEKDMVRPEELRELLRRFLALNSPSHHAIIFRAFTDICRDVFSGYVDEDHDLAPAAVVQASRHLHRQHSYHGHHCY